MTDTDALTRGEELGGGGFDDLDLDPSMEVITCTTDDLLEAPKLGEDMVTRTKFLIIAHYMENYSELDLIPLSEVKGGTAFQLEEAIMDAVELEDADLQRPPEAKDVLLAPKDGSYRRAVLLKKLTENKFLAYFIDAGGKGVVRVEELKPVTKGVMEFPILGYHVTLKGVKPMSKLILKQSFSCLMERIQAGKREFSIELGDEVKGGGKFAPSHNLILTYKLDGDKTSLNDEINNLKTWEWERYSGGRGNDNELCEHGGFGTKLRAGNDEDSLILHYSMSVGTKFTALVSRVEKDELSPGDTNVVVTLSDDPDYLNCFDVLHRQLERYSVAIQKSQFFPALHERVMFKLITTDETREKYTKLVKIVDKWCRALRLNDNIYLLDTDDTIPFLQLPRGDYDIRRIYGEFFKIPILALRLRVKWQGNSIPYDAALELFKPNTRCSFEITNAVDRVVYEAEFNSVKVPK